MRYSRVFLETVCYELPDEVWTSEQIEQRILPVYERFKLSVGRLELMTGIGERRVWPPETKPSDISARVAAKALYRAQLSPEHIGALVHGSVCRDHLEPATASIVHSRLGLPHRCATFDVSNACLGLLNGVVTVANMIELGQIEAGLVVGTENSRTLLENTIRHLSSNPDLSKRELKLAMASLTIGSGSAAILLVNESLTKTGNRLLGGVHFARTVHVNLCYSTKDAAGPNMLPLMWTDSEQLLVAGVDAAKEAFGQFLKELDWQAEQIDRTFCHQVGKMHQRALFEALGLDLAVDFCTYPYLGNTGSVALPITAAIGIEKGLLRPGDKVALLGIGSGVNVVMLGVEWSSNGAQSAS